MTEHLDKRLLTTDAGAAAAARVWLDGESQKAIAKAFGYVGPAPVNVAIVALIRRYCPDALKHESTYRPWDGCYDYNPDVRKEAAKRAISMYVFQRDQRRLKERWAEIEASAAQHPWSAK